MEWRKVSIKEGETPVETPKIKNHSVTLYKDKLYVFGGYDSRRNHNSLITFNVYTESWSVIKNSTIAGNVPPGRNGHTATLAGHKIFIIGGWLGSGPLAADDAWVLDVQREDKLAWYKLENEGCPPGPCNMHSADYVPCCGSVYVFRGGNGREYLHDLHALDVETLVWTNVETTGNPPQMRANHSSAVLGDELFIFGGWNGKERLNDLNILDCRTSAWTAPKIAGILPHPRAGMSLTALRGRLYLFGGSGSSSKCFCDLQILDRKELRWLDVSTKDSAHPSARKGAAVPSSNPNEEDRHVITAYGQMPGKRAGHTSTAVDRRIFVFGGSCGPEYLSDFFVLDTDPPPEVVVRTKSCIKSMETNLEKWFNDEEFSDVTFVVQGRQIFAHRLVLASASEYFKAMFSTGFREASTSQKEIEIPYTSYESFLDVVSYIYSGKLPSFASVFPPYSNSRPGSGHGGGALQRNGSFMERERESGQGGNVDEDDGQQAEETGQTEGSIAMGMSYEEEGFMRQQMKDQEGGGGGRERVVSDASNNLEFFASKGGRMDEAQMQKACEILEMSDQYMLDHLKQVCERLLTFEVCDETVDFLLSHANDCQAEQLSRFCQYFARNSSQQDVAELGGLGGDLSHIKLGDEN